MTHLPHRTLAGLFAILAALIMSSCGQNAARDEVGHVDQDPHVLIFAMEPSFRLTTNQQSNEALIEMLEKETGNEIRFQTGTDYAAVIKGLRDGKIDVAEIGPLSYILAKNQSAPITLVAVRVNEKGKPPGYQSYGITWTGSPIKTLADFRGRRICFVDRNSTSGYLYPSAALLDAGIDPKKDIIPIFAAGDDASVLAVANHRCDAGFAYDTVVDQQLIDQGRLQPGQITTVWKSTTIPGPPLVIANHLSAKLRQQLAAALQNKANADYLRANGFCQDKCAISEGTSYGYQPANDADYRILNDICRKVQGSPCVEN